MNRSLVSIINDCESFHDVEFNDADTKLFLGHLERYAGRDNEPTLRITCTEDAIRKFFAGRLLLFSYLTGKTEVTAGVVGHTKVMRIEKPTDLYVLKISEVGVNKIYYQRRTDRRLYGLYMGIMRWGYVYGFPDIAAQIDDLGNDPGVVNNLGAPVSYQTVKECPFPYRRHQKRNGGMRRPRKLITEEEIKFIVSRGPMYDWNAAMAKQSIKRFSHELIHRIFREHKPKG